MSKLGTIYLLAGSHLKWIHNTEKRILRSVYGLGYDSNEIHLEYF